MRFHFDGFNQRQRRYHNIIIIHPDIVLEKGSPYSTALSRVRFQYIDTPLYFSTTIPPTTTNMLPPKTNKHQPNHKLFVKNVPQESARGIPDLYARYNPIAVKNIYPTGTITTFIIILPTSEAAKTAQRETDGLPINSSIISVERYNAKQSTVVRRETRRKHCNDEHSSFEIVDDEEGYEAETDSWEDAELVIYTPATTTVQSRKGSTSLSWADIAKRPSSPPPASPTIPAETAPQTVPQTPAIALSPALSPQKPRLVTTRAAIATPIIPLPQRSSFSTPSSNTFCTAPQCPTPPKRSEQSRQSVGVGADSSQQTQVSNVEQAQSGLLPMPIDTTAYIRNRHYAACAFCQVQMRRQ